MRGLWHVWLQFEAWVIKGLIPPPGPRTSPAGTAPEPKRSRPGRSTSAPPGSASGQKSRSGARGRPGQAEPHLPFDLVAAYMSIGLPHDSKKVAVRQRLRQLMKEAHPDRHPPEKAERAARRMRELTRSRDTLRRYGRLP